MPGLRERREAITLEPILTGDIKIRTHALHYFGAYGVHLDVSKVKMSTLACVDIV